MKLGEEYRDLLGYLPRGFGRKRMKGSIRLWLGHSWLDSKVPRFFIHTGTQNAWKYAGRG
ncbi:MAG: hypothetical protein HFH94_09685 [Lachnospiraceae bacterium]|nr:hypothetical protein [uncultured Acetatifactor sp.]MCI9219994.1 hypothetical protein [Lachnospiraceae bacterium]